MSNAERHERRSDGFLERGNKVARFEAFVDAAFAFAVTLLVISLDGMPTNRAELVAALQGIPSFAASFTLVAYIWFAHHTWSRRYGLEDLTSVCLSLVLVFFVLVWVYPLRVLFAAAFAWLTRFTLPSDWQFPFHYRIDGMADLQFMYWVYAAAWSSLGVVIVLLYRQGWKRRDALRLTREERIATRAEIARWHWLWVTGILSAVIALLLPTDGPGWLAGAPGMAYMAMAFTGLVMTRAERRWAPRVDAELVGKG